MYNCFDIAKEFLKLGNKDHIAVSQMKLLKLTYIAHGIHLGLTGQPLFYNRIEAWKFGPVIPDLYHITKVFRSFPIDIRLLDIHSNKELSNKYKELIKAIWDGYKTNTAQELVNKTHQVGSPWHQVYNQKKRGIEIPNKLIKAYYTQLIN